MATGEQHLAGGHDEHGAMEHAHPGAGTYVFIGGILAFITLLEVWAYTQEFLRPMLVPILLVLSATKFVLVVGC